MYQIKHQLVVLFCLFFIKINSQTIIPPNNSNIQYIGRIDFSNPMKPLYANPGVSIKAKFQGTSIGILMEELGAGGSSNTNHLNAIIDGGSPIVLALSRNQRTYNIANNLSNGEHTIEIFKRTEAFVGKVAFEGFILDSGKTLVTPNPLLPLKIELIGDSITCGYGNGVASNSPGGFTSLNEDNYRAWGAVAARNLGTQYVCTAYSGRGLMQNGSGTTNSVLPIIYRRIFGLDGNSATWDISNYVPDVVVINLGTNDFFAEINGQGVTVTENVFVNAYKDFVSELRGYYPNAAIICALGTMMNNNNAQSWTRVQNYTTRVVNELNNSGDNNVYYFAMNPQTAPFGEDYHPSAAIHLRMGNELADFIRSNDILPSLGVYDDFDFKKAQVYPNPFLNEINIKLASQEYKKVEIRILNTAGVVLISKMAETNTPITLGDKLPQGIYFIESTVNGNKEIIKVIKR